MPVQNIALHNLPLNVWRELEPHLRERQFLAGTVLFRPGEKVRHVLFMVSGVVSLVTPLATGDIIEFAMIGRDGVVGGMAALGNTDALYQAVVQVDGNGFALETDVARRLVRDHEQVRSLLARHEQFLLAQAQQSSACNASHNLDQRLSRWLLRVRDVTGSDTFRLTQEFMSEMLGVRRTSLTVVAGKFQQAGWLSYVRGQIKLERPDALENRACECYEAVNSHYEVQFGADQR